MEGEQKECAKREWSDQLTLGEYRIRNRVCLAALTRQRCDPKDGIPTDLLVKYYEQRSGPGIMLTEAAAWHPRGQAFPGNGNIYTKQQAQGWKKVIDAVHKKGALIFIQIFHAGRATHEKINGGLQVWGPSALPCRESIRVLGGEPYPVPKQMTKQEIKQVQEQFRQAVILAKQAGFDGVQLHGAHGYLVDSFTRSCTNTRTDQYGGSVQNRCRFACELLDIALEYYQPWQLGMKVSPVSRLRDMIDDNPVETYTHLVKQLENRKIGFLEMRQSTQINYLKSHYTITPPEQIEKVCKTFRPFFNGIMIANDSFEPESGINYIREGSADMISFGRLYVSNPDLAQRILKGQKPNPNWQFATFFGHQHGEKGYIDYPFYDEQHKEQK